MTRTLSVASLAAVAFIASASAAPEPVAKIRVGISSGLVLSAAGSVWTSDLISPRVVRIDPATNAITRRVKVGQHPFGLAYGARSLWVSDRNLDRLTRINPLMGKVQARIKIGISSYGLAFGAGSVWVTSESDRTLRRINPKRNRVSAKIRAGSQPNGVVYAFGAIWVADLGGGRVLKVDARRNKVVARYPVPHADWITPSADALWISTEGDVVVKLDPATGASLAQIPVGHNPLASAWIEGEL